MSEFKKHTDSNNREEIDLIIKDCVSVILRLKNDI